MNVHQSCLLEPDRQQIDRFVDLIFRHVPEGYISLRSMNADNTVFNIEAVHFNGSGMKPVCDAAMDRARRAAAIKTEHNSVVFCPPVAVFNNGRQARQEDLLCGPALSVDCDHHPERSRADLEAILGPPTVLVKSGGIWVDPESGEIEDKLHLHWRLSSPAAGDEALAKLKRARALANAVIAGDTSNNPVSHPLRWPGSWHRKGDPRLCSIDVENPDVEIDLDAVMPKLEAAPKREEAKKKPDEDATGEERARDWGDCIAGIVAGKELHENIARLASKLVAAGYNDGAAVGLLRGVMDQSAARVSRSHDWMSRRDDIPRAVSTAREKYERPDPGAVAPIDPWSRLDPPELPRGLLPPVIEHFAFTQGDLMGADPAGLAIAAITVCAAAIPDRVKLQVKEHDPSFLVAPIIWAALIGDPSSKKSPMLDIAAYPLKRIDAEMAAKYMRAKEEYDSLAGEEKKETKPPKKTRVRIEDTTIEAAQEILKDSPDGVLCKRDELSGWFGGMDKYSAGKGAAADRGFWLQAYNGGEYVSDRVGRGMCFIPNLSISLLGGIQPGVIREIIGQTVDDGLIQRLIPVSLRPATVGKDEPRDSGVQEYNDLVTALHKTKSSFGFRSDATIKFSPEGQAIRRRLEQRHVDLVNCAVINRKLAAHIGKYDGIFARLCLVWHCIEHTECGRPISGDTAGRVAEFLHGFLLPHAMSFYAGDLGLAEESLQELAGYILAHETERLTFREIARCGGSLKRLSRQEMTAILQQLDALGWVTEVPGPRVMSPSQWVVNPVCHKLFRERREREKERRHKASETMKEDFVARASERKQG